MKNVYALNTFECSLQPFAHIMPGTKTFAWRSFLYGFTERSRTQTCHVVYPDGPYLPYLTMHSQLSTTLDEPGQPKNSQHSYRSTPHVTKGLVTQLLRTFSTYVISFFCDTCMIYVIYKCFLSLSMCADVCRGFSAARYLREFSLELIKFFLSHSFCVFFVL